MSAHDIEQKERTKDVLPSQSNNHITFTSLILSESTISGLNKNGFQKPSPIQLKAIPIGKCGFDLIVKSKSGTGKTLVFSVIALEMINPSKNVVQVLVLAPTREIATQISDVINDIGFEHKGLKAHSFIGGRPLEDDIKNLQNCNIAVGAPGRVKQLIEQKYLKTESIRLFVLDEADKLMEYSYQSDINAIYSKLSSKKQMIALSATYPDQLDMFLMKYMLTPTHISPDIDSPLLLGIKQFVCEINTNSNVIRQMNIKTDYLVLLLSKISFNQCLIFSNFQTRVETVSKTLNGKGWASTYISAAQNQTDRLEAVKNLKEFKCRILLSTDLTARGIDAANVDMVINFDVPHDASTYLHRMGRAGRYGSRGLCITLASKGKDMNQFQDIIGMIGGNELTIAKLPNTEETFPTNLWESNCEEMEQVSGKVDLNFTDEKSVRLKNIKNSIFELKKSTVKKESSTNSTSELEDKEENIEETKHNTSIDNTTSKLPADNDIESILLKLANKEEVEDSLLEGASVSSVKQRVTPSPKRRRPNDASDIEPISNVAKFLMDDLDSEINLESREYVTNFINKVKTEETKQNSSLVEELETYSCHDVLENIDNIIKNEELDGLENIFETAYNYAVDNSKEHWSSTVNIPPPELAAELDRKINLLDASSEEGYSSDLIGMSTAKVSSKKSRACRSSNNRTETANVNNQIEEITEDIPIGLRWEPVVHQPCENVASQSTLEYQQHDVNVQNQQYIDYYNRLSENLERKVTEFEDVASFDQFFVNWQWEVNTIRDFVQQNIYLKEMNNYQYNKNYQQQ